MRATLPSSSRFDEAYVNFVDPHRSVFDRHERNGATRAGFVTLTEAGHLLTCRRRHKTPKPSRALQRFLAYAMPPEWPNPSFAKAGEGHCWCFAQIISLAPVPYRSVLSPVQPRLRYSHCRLIRKISKPWANSKVPAGYACCEVSALTAPIKNKTYPNSGATDG
jgi:hypothetical protein